MPQIAQQDYVIIAPRPGYSADTDCQAMKELKEALLKGIVFDCIVKDAFRSGSDTYGRVLTFDKSYVYLLLTTNYSIQCIYIALTPAQFSGLAAVQVAEEEAMGQVVGVPTLTITDSFLVEDNESYLICCDDYKIIVTVDDNDNIVAVEKSTEKVTEGEDYFNVPFDKIQELIGITTA